MFPKNWLLVTAPSYKNWICCFEFDFPFIHQSINFVSIIYVIYIARSIKSENVKATESLLMKMPAKISSITRYYTTQKIKFSIKDFFSKCDQIRSFLRIWSHLLKKSFMKNFIFCAVLTTIQGSFPGAILTFSIMYKFSFKVSSLIFASNFKRI